MPVLFAGHNLSPLVKVGLTDLHGTPGHPQGRLSALLLFFGFEIWFDLNLKKIRLVYKDDTQNREAFHIFWPG